MFSTLLREQFYCSRAHYFDIESRMSAQDIQKINVQSKRIKLAASRIRALINMNQNTIVTFSNNQKVQ